MNIPEVAVSRRPVVALIPTGDELVLPGETPGPDQIISSNNFGLAAMLAQMGAEARLGPIARDNADSLRAALAAARGADVIVTLGGASVGDHDLVAKVLGNEGLTLDFTKLQCGQEKPLMAGQIDGACMLGLPGNPVSAMVCGEIFLRPALDAAMGLPARERPTRRAKISHDLARNGPREHYMRARLESDGRVTVFDRQDSSLVRVLSNANALVVRTPLSAALQADAEVGHHRSLNHAIVNCLTALTQTGNTCRTTRHSYHRSRTRTCSRRSSTIFSCSSTSACRRMACRPSFDEMKSALDLRSKSGIHRLITALEERGFIRRLAHRARAIEILRLPENIEDKPVRGFRPSVIEGDLGREPETADAIAKLQGAPVTAGTNAQSVPLIGRIAAGIPIEAMQQGPTDIGVPSMMMSSGGEHYALEVKGDSMIDAGIHEDDIVVIQRQSTANNGDIIVALIDEHEATLKRLRRKGGAIALEAANPSYGTRLYRADQVKIQGKMVGANPDLLTMS